ncbi:hypothetical protein HK096_006566 [Nowakowskiella sp. JEL0078]|nr:hypothetical protein HK096_006566 [Nowakowskiella sp. JEL0078]
MSGQPRRGIDRPVRLASQHKAKQSSFYADPVSSNNIPDKDKTEKLLNRTSSASEKQKIVSKVKRKRMVGDRSPIPEHQAVPGSTGSSEGSSTNYKSSQICELPIKARPNEVIMELNHCKKFKMSDEEYQRKLDEIRSEEIRILDYTHPKFANIHEKFLSRSEKFIAELQLQKDNIIGIFEAQIAQSSSYEPDLIWNKRCLEREIETKIFKLEIEYKRMCSKKYLAPVYHIPSLPKSLTEVSESSTDEMIISSPELTSTCLDQIFNDKYISLPKINRNEIVIDTSRPFISLEINGMTSPKSVLKEYTSGPTLRSQTVKKVTPVNIPESEINSSPKTRCRKNKIDISKSEILQKRKKDVEKSPTSSEIKSAIMEGSPTSPCKTSNQKRTKKQSQNMALDQSNHLRSYSSTQYVVGSTTSPILYVQAIPTSNMQQIQTIPQNNLQHTSINIQHRSQPQQIQQIQLSQTTQTAQFNQQQFWTSPIGQIHHQHLIQTGSQPLIATPILTQQTRLVHSPSNSKAKKHLPPAILTAVHSAGTTIKTPFFVTTTSMISPSPTMNSSSTESGLKLENPPHLGSVRNCNLPPIGPSIKSQLVSPVTSLIVCCVCRNGEREDELWLCDQCNQASHSQCLDVSVPVPLANEDWYCSQDCETRARSKRDNEKNYNGNHQMILSGPLNLMGGTKLEPRILVDMKMGINDVALGAESAIISMNDIQQNVAAAAVGWDSDKTEK